MKLQRHDKSGGRDLQMANAGCRRCRDRFPSGGKSSGTGIETIFASPSQTMTFTAHYVAHEAGLFQKEGPKVADATSTAGRRQRNASAATR
jgi:hypothetical protein